MKTCATLISTLSSKQLNHSIALVLCFASLSLFSKTEKYRLVWTTDPATEISIGWNQLTGDAPILYYDEINHGAETDLYQFSKRPDFVVDFRAMDNHFVRLTGLKPTTVYWFTIKDSEGINEILSFRTGPDNNKERLSVIVGSDSRNHRKARRNANELVAKLRPDCVMFGGDFTDRDDYVEWREWFEDWQSTISPDGRMYPIIPTRGNHEYSPEVLRNLFDVRSRGQYYAQTLAGDLLRIYTLNSMIVPGGEQSDWLKKDLEDNSDVIWKTAQYHLPIMPHIWEKPPSISQLVSWAGLFYKHGFAFIAESDSHVVKSTYPIRPDDCEGSEDGFIRDDEFGTVYIGEGCWGAPLRWEDNLRGWTRAAASFNSFQWVFIDKNKIEIRFVKTNSSPLVKAKTEDSDRFEIPADLEIWNPNNGTGDVIKIFPKPKVNQTIPLNNLIDFRQNTPNPFNTTTFFSYDVKSEIAYKTSKLVVRDFTGKILKEIDAPLVLGCHEIPFTPENLNSTVLFYTLEVDGRPIEFRQMLFLMKE